jgi:hypothetical protein
MIIALGLFVICVIIILFFWEMTTRPAIKTVISHFWYFSILWLFFFPVRAIFINEGWVDLQIEQYFSVEQLFFSLLLAFFFWISSYLGYKSTKRLRSPRQVAALILPEARHRRVLWGLILLALIFIGTTLIDGVELKQFKGNEQNEARTGAGPIFVLSVLYMLGFVSLLGVQLFIKKNKASEKQRFFLLTTATVLSISVIFSISLKSRRYIAEPLLGLLIVFLVSRDKGIGLAILAVLSTFLAAPILQLFRYIDVASLATLDMDLVEHFAQVVDLRFALTSLSSSFEGIDHLTAYLQQAGWFGFIFGTDGGLAWLFNAGLGLIPRTLWTNKPEIYGSVAQQYFLYPWMYADGAATTTIPVSYLTDFMFGLGLLVGLLMAFMLGRLFNILQEYLWNKGSHFILKGLSLFVFLNMFNVLRGGTGCLQSVIMFFLVGIAMYGFLPVKRAVGQVLMDLFSIHSSRILNHRLGPNR